jgi:hypothetical protein
MLLLHELSLRGGVGINVFLIHSREALSDFFPIAGVFFRFVVVINRDFQMLMFVSRLSTYENLLKVTVEDLLWPYCGATTSVATKGPIIMCSNIAIQHFFLCFCRYKSRFSNVNVCFQVLKYCG